MASYQYGRLIIMDIRQDLFDTLKAKEVTDKAEKYLGDIASGILGADEKQLSFDSTARIIKAYELIKEAQKELEKV